MRGVRVLPVVAGLVGLCGLGDGPRSKVRSACEAAFEARQWERTLEACGPDAEGGATPLGRVRHAWAQLYVGSNDAALAEATALFETSEGAEARYLGGLILKDHDAPERVALGRDLLEEAMRRFIATGRRDRASDAACSLVTLALSESRFDDALELANRAVSLASATSDVGRRGIALIVLAATNNVIGLAEQAREAFRRAEAELVSRPAELAWAYFKHVVFLLEFHSVDSALEALQFLDAAQRNFELAIRAGMVAKVAGLQDAIHFNRAAALSALGRDAEALELLAALPEGQRDHAAYHRITAVAAARRGDIDAALAFLDQRLENGEDGDYAVSASVELARVFGQVGRVHDAERALHRAIEQVEHLRQQSSLELRPWILARRAAPYASLIELLLAQARAADALAVMESLQARAWLDATTPGADAASDEVAREPAHSKGDEVSASGDAQTAGTIAATPPLDGAALVARIGDREALVLLDLQSSAWRAHILGGAVRVAPVPASAFATLASFHASPELPEVAAAAAAILVPTELSRSARPLTIVASGRFAELPFPALRRGDHLLIEERAIARLPGLVAARCAPRVATGPPVFLGDSEGDLPQAAAEVRALAGAHHVPAHVGAAATREAVRTGRGASWLHLAVHGEVGPQGGELSLRGEPLTASLVRRERLAPDVVVLAGCSTAASDDPEGWGAFPSAFLSAGSRYVIATTRSVADDAASAVMHAFYAQPERLDPIERLAAAQRALVAKTPAAAWASFAAWGTASCSEE
ncbi:MAG: CHAT domain-containing protein [Kofleriaceae bacterium]